MNVLLINPPSANNIKIIREGRCMQQQDAWGTNWAPITLATMGAVLKKHGFVARIVDCSNDNVDFDQLADEIRRFEPSLIIVSTATPSIISDLQVAGLARKIVPHIRTVFFGIHTTALPGEVFAENGDVEFLVRGEPEYTVRDLALALRDGLPFDKIPGLVYRNEKGEVVVNEARPFIENLDELPFPAWELINISGYRLPITRYPFLLVATSRGCPFPCTFCAASAFYGKKPRVRSPEAVVEEMRYVRNRFGVRDFLFWSESSMTNRRQMIEISEKLATEIPDARWVCNGRVTDANRSLLEAMKRAGCWMIGYGIESGSQRVLDLMNKKVTLEDMERAVAATKEAGLEVTAHVIVGYPAETPEDIQKTSDLLKRLDVDYIQVYCCVPFPGSRLYDELKDSDMLATTEWSMFEQHTSIIHTPGLSPGDVVRWREKMIRDFYFAPRKIWKTLVKLRSWREVRTLYSFAKQYFFAWVASR